MIDKVENLLKGSLDSITFTFHENSNYRRKSLLEVERQNIAGCCQHNFENNSLLTMPSNVLPLHLKQTFLPIIWIFTEGDEIESRLPIKIFSTLPCWSFSDICQLRLDFDNFDITETTAGVCTDSFGASTPAGQPTLDLCGTLTGSHCKFFYSKGGFSTRICTISLLYKLQLKIPIRTNMIFNISFHNLYGLGI